MIEPLTKFGFIHNEMEQFWIFDYGRCKFPDFVHETEKIVLEYNGHFFHGEKDIPIWTRNWKRLGYTCLIIWDFERFDIENINSLEELIERYPCEYREPE